MATLYRKYRSKRFDELIGQDPIVTTLTNQIRLGRIGHAYLFTGSRGTGKTSCARIFARAVNCLHPDNGNPCGECEACKALAGDNVDIIEMDAASNNGVDDARDIREKVKYLPVACKYKVYIIDEVHMLTGGAFNALLKTIEEPPEHVIFILATTEPQKLPQTILSRCIRFDFRLVPIDTLAAHIAKIYTAEGVKYTADAVREIARLGEGSVRDALSVADTLMSAAEEITTDVVLGLTGAGDSSAIAELFDSTAGKDLSTALAAVDRFAKNGKSVSAVCRQLIDYARNVLVAKSVGAGKATDSGLINADGATIKRIAASADRFDMDDISRLLGELSSCENGLKYSVNPRVFLETSLVRLVCGAQREADLLKRIAALEKTNSALDPAEQKKNNPIARETPRPQAADRGDTLSRVDEPDIMPPPFEPPPERYDDVVQSAPPSMPRREQSIKQPERKTIKEQDGGELERPVARKSGADSPTHIVKVDAADEGEFWHLRAQSTDGLELLGAVARALRKMKTPESEWARELLSRGVAVKERADAIGFVAPEDSFLLIGEQRVLDTLNGVLDGLGIKKRARVERTADDLYEEDLLRAAELFGRDGVVPRAR